MAIPFKLFLLLLRLLWAEKKGANSIIHPRHFDKQKNINLILPFSNKVYVIT